jgi:putative tryptophan/tyrosine transport system substrate-binding protein
MKRGAALLAALALGAIMAGAPLTAAAQQPGKVFRIGILSPAERSSTKIFDAFREGLRDLGYIDGQNIRIEYRLAAGDTSRLHAMAGELVRLPVEVIVTDTQKSAVIVHEATRTIPIVGATLGPDPVAAGLATSLARPGGNVTGFSGFGVELAGKRLQLLKEVSPAISRMAALWNPAMPISVRRATEEAARTLGMQLRTIEVAAPDEILAGFEAAAASGAEGLVVLPDALFWNHRTRIVALAVKYRTPAIYPEREYVDDGGLLAYGASVPDNFRRAAGYVDKILKGAKPADLPIQLPTKFELVVNLKTAQAVGLTIPPSILARADEVIE